MLLDFLVVIYVGDGLLLFTFFTGVGLFPWTVPLATLSTSSVSEAAWIALVKVGSLPSCLDNASSTASLLLELCPGHQ